LKERNHFIDLAKGIAIILVLFNHYEWKTSSIFSTHLYYWVICMAVPIFMLCTGYVTAASFSSKGTSLRDAYSKKLLLPKLARYILPVLWFYIFETVITLVFQKTGFLHYLSTLDFPYAYGYNKRISLLGTVIFFFAGGRGIHGTYYFAIILQIAFMIPLIYTAVKKWKWGLWLCFGINLFLEIIKIPIGLPYAAFRMLAFRYIFIVAFGCWLYIYRNEKFKPLKWSGLFLAGAVYVYVINYTSYHRVIFTTWHQTSMIAALYIAPIFMLGLKHLKNAVFKPLEEIGKASYHILMVQILYYNFFAPLVWTAPKSVIPNDFIGFTIGLIFCLAFGYGYYRLYGFISRKIKAI